MRQPGRQTSPRHRLSTTAVVFGVIGILGTVVTLGIAFAVPGPQPGMWDTFFLWLTLLAWVFGIFAPVVALVLGIIGMVRRQGRVAVVGTTLGGIGIVFAAVAFLVVFGLL